MLVFRYEMRGIGPAWPALRRITVTIASEHSLESSSYAAGTVQRGQRRIQDITGILIEPDTVNHQKMIVIKAGANASAFWTRV